MTTSFLPSVSSSRSVPRVATSRLAIASFVLGLLSVLGAAALLLPTLLAIVLGHAALTRIRRDPATIGGHGLALAGCILGYGSIVTGIAILGFVGAMTIPAFQKVRTEGTQKMLAHDARQIAAAAQQVMLEDNVTEVSFTIDPESGRVSGPISPYVKSVSAGTRQVDGVVEARGTFSLQHPRAFGGQPVTYDATGRRQSP